MIMTLIINNQNEPAWAAVLLEDGRLLRGKELELAGMLLGREEDDFSNI